MYIGKLNNYNGIISILAEVLSVFQKFVPTVKNYQVFNNDAYCKT